MYTVGMIEIRQENIVGENWKEDREKVGNCSSRDDGDMVRKKIANKTKQTNKKKGMLVKVGTKSVRCLWNDPTMAKLLTMVNNTIHIGQEVAEQQKLTEDKRACEGDRNDGGDKESIPL